MPKVLIAIPGLDGHDRGAKILSRELKNNGMNVIYLGIRQTAAKIASKALQENVDVICLSMHSGGHLIHVPRLFSQMEKYNINNIPVIVGGIIPDQDTYTLKKMGVVEVFGTKSNISDILNLIEQVSTKGL